MGIGGGVMDLSGIGWWFDEFIEVLDGDLMDFHGDVHGVHIGFSGERIGLRARANPPLGLHSS